MNGRVGWTPAGWCALGALLFYGLALSRSPDPATAETMAHYAGLTPFVPILHPLWSLLSHLALHAPGSTLALRLHGISLLLAAASAGLFYRLVARLPCTPREKSPPAILSVMLGTTAAAALCLLMPLASAITRADPAVFELLFMLLWLTSAQAYGLGSGRCWFWITCMLAGPAWVEITAAPAVLIAMAILLAVLAWQREHRPVPILIRGGLLVLVSTICAVMAWAWIYVHLDANTWRHPLSVPSVSIALLRHQLFATQHHVLGFGWLLTTVLTIIPAVVSLTLSRQTLLARSLWSRSLPCLVLLPMSALLLLNTPLAPWRLFSIEGLFIPPLLLAAATPAFVLALAYNWLKPLSWSPARWEQRAIPILGASAAVLLLTAAIRLTPSLSPRRAAPLYTWARLTIDALAGRPWLVTAGATDGMLYLAAHDAGRRIMLLNLSQGRRAEYRAAVTATLPTPRLQALAHAGLVPMLRNWLAHEPNAPEQVAVLFQPELWLSAGAAFLPDTTLYRGTREPTRADAVALVRAETAAVTRLHEPLLALSRSPDLAGHIARRLHDNLGAHANNLGLALENLGQPVRAARAYRQALQVQPDNVCAMLNLARLTSRHPRASAASENADSASSLADIMTRHRDVPLPLLVARFGHIRDPEALDMLRPLVREPRDSTLRQAAEVYLRGDFEAARNILEQRLRAASPPPAAWVLRGVLAFREGETATVDRCAAELESKGQESVPLLVLQARQRTARGDNAKARELLTHALTLSPHHFGALETLLALELQADSTAPVESTLEQILTLDPGHAMANFALGVRLFHAGQLDAAQAAFQTSLEREASPQTLNNLAWILQSRGDVDSALPLVEQALQLDPNFASALDTKAVILMQMGNTNVAAEAMDRAKSLGSNSSM